MYRPQEGIEVNVRLINQITFTTPTEPPRLTSVSSYSLNGKKDRLTISFNGTSLPEGPGNIKVKQTDSDLLVEGKLTRKSPTECTAVISTAWTEDTTHLSFGKRYSVESATFNSIEILVDSDISFDVPNPAVITSFSVPAECSSNSFDIEVIGQNLPSSGKYTLTLSDSHSISITFSIETAGKGTVKAGLPTAVQFGREYSVLSVTNGDDHVLFNQTTFTTPLGPTLNSISTDWKSPDKKEVILTLSGLRMMAGEYTLTFHEQGETTNLTISVTIDTKTTGSGSAVIYDGPKLNYGTTYEVLSLTSDTLHFALAPSLKFTTDPEPARLTSISCTRLSDEDRKADFTVGGRMMTIDGQYTIAVNETGTSVQRTFGVAMSSTKEGTGSAVLFSQTEEEMELDYATEYEVVGVKNPCQSQILIEPNLKFRTGSEPTRLVSFSIAGYEEKQKKVKFEMAGRVLHRIKLFKVGLSISSDLKHTVLMADNIETEKWEGSAALFPSSVAELEYGKTYTVSSFKMGDDAAELFFEGNSITIGSESSRLVKIANEDDEGLNSTTLTLSSRVLTVGGKYEMKVTGTPLPSSSSSSNGNHETTLTFKATSATENTVRLTLYPLEDAIVKYGHSYSVDWMKVVDGASILVETEGCVFVTPKEPARICSWIRAVLNKDRTKVTISLEGRAFAKPLGSIWVSLGDTFLESLSMRRISETLCEADFPVSSNGNPLSMKYEEAYTLCMKPDGKNTLLVDNGITVHIPAPPSFTEVKFNFTNSLGTGCIAVLTGTDLVVGTEYEVTLNTSYTFLIMVKSSTHAESSEMEIGVGGTITYSTHVLIETIEPIDEESGIVLTPSPFSGQIPARPNVNEIFVDSETGHNNQTCGDLSRPCSTMDVAWQIMRKLNVFAPTFSLLNSSSLSSQMSIESGMSVLIQNGTNSEPSLHIPSSTPESATSPLIVVSSALLNIQNIDLVVGSSDPSFILISASSSKMILKDGLITVKTETVLSRNEMEDLCDWTTGLIELTETELNVTNNRFFNISQGAISMNGGELNIHGSIFTNNSPNHQTFSSARRNIVCSEDGTVRIESLSAGDGTLLHPSAWMSSEGCSIESTEVNVASPLFVPTLSSDSTSKFDKKTKSFTLTIEGSVLIPCSLFLKVIAMRRDGTESNSILIPLTVDSATSFTETKIVFTLSSSSVGSLDNSLEWQGRLTFGNNQTTNNSFVIQQNSSDRLAQSVKDNMKWWIPLVVVLSCALLALILVVVLLMRRRNKNKGRKSENDGEQELDQTEYKIDVLNAEGNNDDHQNTVITSNHNHIHDNPTISEYSSKAYDVTKLMAHSAGQAPVLIMGEDHFGQPTIETTLVNSQDTLFNRLHGREDRPELNIHQARLDVVKAVETLFSHVPHALALQRLSPHWVFYTPSNAVCFRLNDDPPSQAPTTIPTQSGPQKEMQEEKRWSAPEEENRENGIDEKKVTVFRLGLILWEITTGQVPFSETDAVNAQRQLGMGIVPRMDSIEPVELSTLLTECLDLNPACRPSLDSVVSRLESIEERKKEEGVDLLELPNRQEPQPESRKPKPTFQHI
ncbi:hypothetical protein BLNAU_14399 [Blattamonas nauphoetae]|uniref:Protein kinase domain-containing protein n=1 Tax=Blattamonas nauphoetae TaxID=2049346 RepID=A0ABQ9XE40_9EUKA|nr:hypothetical protein BLNAU_14399 [Blattamonas nauphoetae]